jgi:hypothetical protein
LGIAIVQSHVIAIVTSLDVELTDACNTATCNALIWVCTICRSHTYETPAGFIEYNSTTGIALRAKIRTIACAIQAVKALGCDINTLVDAQIAAVHGAIIVVTTMDIRGATLLIAVGINGAGAITHCRVTGIDCALVPIVAIGVLKATLATYNLCELATQCEITRVYGAIQAIVALRDGVDALGVLTYIIRTCVGIIAIQLLRRHAAFYTISDDRVDTLSRLGIADIGCAFIPIVAIAVVRAIPASRRALVDNKGNVLALVWSGTQLATDVVRTYISIPTIAI